MSARKSAGDELSARSNGLASGRVVEIQRARMLTAMAAVCAERGAANATVAHVVERAGVSRRTFYELFTDREDCFLAAFDEGIERVAAGVLPLWAGGGSWRERLRASLIELLSFLDSDPGTGRLVVVEALGAGHRALQRRGNVLALLFAAVDGGRAEAKAGSEPSPLTAEGVVGAVLSVLYGRMVEADPRPLLELVNPLMSMIVLPYLGPAAARRELSRPVPEPPARPARVCGDPLQGLPMRITYRTIRVLLALADAPGCSNRQVGEAAGIADQGQISKLLRRLHRLGLIENTGAGATRGERNEWTLTPRGHELELTLREGSGG
jgi:AcrR family transcriptional regulator